ncbi:hypothetical protein ARUE_c22090 [Arthrobacter sp. Rue61a]|jgi:hypothetical protein|nr:hypothetical protein ARUE_c22090 [Arthrobacter sp. Rue61a]MBP2265831.1 hypothetical protein [Pseudarthrobacter sp. PvP004]
MPILHAVFGVLAILGFMFIRRFASETKGRQLEKTQQFRRNGREWPEVETTHASSQKTTEPAGIL